MYLITSQVVESRDDYHRIAVLGMSPAHVVILDVSFDFSSMISNFLNSMHCLVQVLILRGVLRLIQIDRTLRIHQYPIYRSLNRLTNSYMLNTMADRLQSTNDPSGWITYFKQSDRKWTSWKGRGIENDQWPFLVYKSFFNSKGRNNKGLSIISNDFLYSITLIFNIVSIMPNLVIFLLLGQSS